MKKFILALAAIAALASCQKKDEMKPYVGDTERPVMFSVENYSEVLVSAYCLSVSNHYSMKLLAIRLFLFL